MEIKNYKESKFFKGGFRAIYQDMLQEVSSNEYSCFEEFTLELEQYILNLLIHLELECSPHPSKHLD